MKHYAKTLVILMGIAVGTIHCGGEIDLGVSPPSDKVPIVIIGETVDTDAVDTESLLVAAKDELQKNPDAVDPGLTTLLENLGDTTTAGDTNNHISPHPGPAPDFGSDLPPTGEPLSTLPLGGDPLQSNQPKLPVTPLVPIEKPKPTDALVKIGDPQARWMVLYDLATSHIMQYASKVPSELMQTSVTPIASNAVKATLNYQVIGTPSYSNSTGGMLQVDRTVEMHSNTGLFALANDVMAMQFNQFTYKHPCLGDFEVTGQVICAGNMAKNKTTNIWGGVYLCTTYSAGLTITVNGNPHEVKFGISKTIEGPVGAASTYQLDGVYKQDGGTYSFPKSVPQDILWCLEP